MGNKESFIGKKPSKYSTPTPTPTPDKNEETVEESEDSLKKIFEFQNSKNSEIKKKQKFQKSKIKYNYFDIFVKVKDTMTEIKKTSTDRCLDYFQYDLESYQVK
jgi:hypothetical protein